jgi:hypothetical protein
MRRGDKPIIVRGQQLTTHFGPYPHGPAITGTRVVLTSESGTIMFDGSLRLFDECIGRGFFVL